MNIAGPLKTLRSAFDCYIVSWAALGPYAVMSADGKHAPAWAVMLMVIGGFCFVVSGFVYLVSLGKVVHRLGKSWIIWVGLTMITSPLGYLFAYPRIKGAAQKMIGEKVAV